MNRGWELIGRPQWPAVCRVALAAQETLTVVTPFVSQEAASHLLDTLERRSTVVVRLLTAGHPHSMMSGACDPAALRMIAERCYGQRVHRLHGLHAKVYVADETMALLTSANLTSSGVWHNYEYGINITDPQTVKAIAQDIGGYIGIATPLGRTALAEIEKVIATTPEAASPMWGDAASAVARAIEDVIVREHVTGKSEHEVFTSSILFVLSREGPLPTNEIHRHIKVLHPELCDDGCDRVIDGRSFGKRWKHQVRTAQQHLKKKGLVALVDGRWRLLPDG